MQSYLEFAITLITYSHFSVAIFVVIASLEGAMIEVSNTASFTGAAIESLSSLESSSLECLNTNFSLPSREEKSVSAYPKTLA